MHKISSKLICLIMTAALLIALTGCLGTDYSLESTEKSARTSKTSETTSPYVRMEFDNAKYPYYSMLSETEKNAYSLIYEELNKGSRKFSCRVDVTADQLSKAIDSVLNDHPELFWLDNNYGYTYDPSGGNIRELSFTFFDFADTPEKLEAARAEFSRAADTITAKALTYNSITDRELYIHDYICQNTEYDADAPYNQSAYSVLVTHKSVCAGYARCFQYLMQKTGATCYYVTGRTEGTSGGVVGGSNSDGSHSWNMLLINGVYCNVDCLWDDTASDTYGSAIYPFFNLPDSEMVNHVRIEMAVNLPSCSSDEYRYSKQFGPTIEASSIIFADA